MSDLHPTTPATATAPATRDDPLVDLDDMTPDESLLADVRRTRVTTPATRALLALVVVGAAFLGGALVQRWQQQPASSSNAQSLISQIRAAAGSNGGASGASAGSGAVGGGPAALFGGGGGGGGGGGTFGTVKLVDGTNVYVQDVQGNTIKVTTKSATTVSVTKTGKVSELKAGSAVIVQGMQSADGTTMSATSISQSAGVGGGRFPGGAAGG